MKKRFEPSLITPNQQVPLLMHTCCAPCAGDIMQTVKQSGIPFTLFFYNPNIHPKKEYEIRKQENKRYADQLQIPFIDADYDVDFWFLRTKGMENEPERGIRCTSCFDMRFERTALYASEHGFPVMTSTLGISRWKDMAQINHSGQRSASRYGISYWTYNWRKKGGSQRMYEIAKLENFYKQEYCGCVYSLRDTNLWRKKNNRSLIHFGETFY